MSTAINLPDSSSYFSTNKAVFRRKVIILVSSLLLVVGGVLLFTVLIWPSSPRPEFRVEGCGKTGPDFVGTRIVGGRNALKDEFPFQVSIIDTDGDIICGASMINDRWIIGAAHCFYDFFGPNPAGLFKVAVAILNTNEVVSNQMEIEGFWGHPNYTKTAKKWDIVLIKTKKSISASSKNFVSPICLPPEKVDSKDTTFVKASGFGTIKEDGEQPDTLKMSTLQIFSDPLCKDIYTYQFDADSMICAGSRRLQGGEDTCQGDSGGPLAMRNKDGSYVLVGITSYGRGCARKGVPGVYTKVSHYLDWIHDTIQEKGVD